MREHIATFMKWLFILVAFLTLTAISGLLMDLGWSVMDLAGAPPPFNRHYSFFVFWGFAIFMRGLINVRQSPVEPPARD